MIPVTGRLEAAEYSGPWRGIEQLRVLMQSYNSSPTDRLRAELETLHKDTQRSASLRMLKDSSNPRVNHFSVMPLRFKSLFFFAFSQSFAIWCLPDVMYMMLKEGFAGFFPA